MSKLTGGKNEKSKQGFLKWKTMSINGFPMKNLLPKSKEEQTEVISRLISTYPLLLHTNYKNIWTFLHIFWTFLDFFNTFSYLLHYHEFININLITFYKYAKHC